MNSPAVTTVRVNRIAVKPAMTVTELGTRGTLLKFLIDHISFLQLFLNNFHKENSLIKNCVEYSRWNALEVLCNGAINS